MFGSGAFLPQVPLRLGQTQVREGTGFQPGPIYWPGGYGVPQAPGPGAPMTEEILSPEGWHDTLHCYVMPDGSYRSLSMDEASSMKAAGMAISPIDYRYCRGLKGVTAASTAVLAGRNLGQATGGGPSGGGAGGPSSGGPSGGGAGTPSSGAAPSVAPSFTPGDFAFAPPWYPYPSYAPPPPNQRLICRKLEDQSAQEGRDVMECNYEPAVPVIPTMNYPVIRIFPFF